MGNVTYAVNERVRRLLRFLIIGLVVMLVISPFFIFSSYGCKKMHDWAIAHPDSGLAPGLLYNSARIHCLMGALSDERYVPAQTYFEEYIGKYPNHKKAPYGYFYLAWSIENQKRADRQQRRDEAKIAYEHFVGLYPSHEKRAAADRALNRIEVESGR